MKLILVVAVILVFKTKLSFLSFIDELFQEQDDEYENDESSNDMVESSKGIRVSIAGVTSIVLFSFYL